LAGWGFHVPVAETEVDTGIEAMVLEPGVVRPVLRFADPVIVKPVENQDVVAAFAFDGERGVAHGGQGSNKVRAVGFVVSVPIQPSFHCVRLRVPARGQGELLWAPAQQVARGPCDDVTQAHNGQAWTTFNKL
jgi:hypothetical protein